MNITRYSPNNCPWHAHREGAIIIRVGKENNLGWCKDQHPCESWPHYIIGGGSFEACSNSLICSIANPCLGSPIHPKLVVQGVLTHLNLGRLWSSLGFIGVWFFSLYILISYLKMHFGVCKCILCEVLFLIVLRACMHVSRFFWGVQTPVGVDCGVINFARMKL